MMTIGRRKVPTPPENSISISGTQPVRDRRALAPTGAFRGEVGLASPRTGDRGRKAIKFFTIPEVAECVNVSTRTIRRWIDRGELVAHRFGTAVRIAEADLRAFLAQHRGW